MTSIKNYIFLYLLHHTSTAGITSSSPYNTKRISVCVHIKLFFSPLFTYGAVMNTDIAIMTLKRLFCHWNICNVLSTYPKQQRCICVCVYEAAIYAFVGVTKRILRESERNNPKMSSTCCWVIPPVCIMLFFSLWIINLTNAQSRYRTPTITSVYTPVWTHLCLYSALL